MPVANEAEVSAAVARKSRRENFMALIPLAGFRGTLCHFHDAANTSVIIFKLRNSGMLQQPVFKGIGNMKCLLQIRTRVMNGFAHLFAVAFGGGGNFIKREAFN